MSRRVFGAPVLSLSIAAVMAASASAQVQSPTRLYADDRLAPGDRISVEVVGRGPDVILIPGLASSRETWRRTVDRLKGAWRLHLVQVAGFAGEPAQANASGPLIAPVVNALDAYMKGAGLMHAPVIGHSLGGVIALQLALDHPDDVSRVMLVDTLAFYSELFAGPAATVEGARPFAERMAATMRAATAAQSEAAMDQMTAAMATAPADRARIAAWSAASDRNVVATAMAEDMLADLRPRLASLQVPLTVIYEAPLRALVEGDYAPVRDKTLIAAAPGAKHFIMYDDPAGFDAALDGFLAARP